MCSHIWNYETQGDAPSIRFRQGECCWREKGQRFTGIHGEAFSCISVSDFTPDTGDKTGSTAQYEEMPNKRTVQLMDKYRL